MLEEVKAFGDFVEALGTSYLLKLGGELEAMGYAVAVLNLDASTWLQMSRERCHVIVHVAFSLSFFLLAPISSH